LALLFSVTPKPSPQTGQILFTLTVFFLKVFCRKNRAFYQ